MSTADDIERIIKRIDLQKGVHDILEDDYRTLIAVQKLVNTVFSAIITLIVFADFGLIDWLAPNVDKKYVLLIIGCISFVVFLMNTLYQVFDIFTNLTEHGKAIQLYSDLKLELRNSPDLSRGVEYYNDKYMGVARVCKKVGGKKFERSRVKYLRNEYYKKVLKENPFLTSRQIKRKVKDEFNG